MWNDYFVDFWYSCHKRRSFIRQPQGDCNPLCLPSLVESLHWYSGGLVLTVLLPVRHAVPPQAPQTSSLRWDDPRRDNPPLSTRCLQRVYALTLQHHPTPATTPWEPPAYDMTFSSLNPNYYRKWTAVQIVEGEPNEDSRNRDWSVNTESFGEKKSLNSLNLNLPIC